MATSARRSHDDYTVGWICALPLEMAAAKLMLDEIHEDLPVSSTDHNTYILGRVKKHNVVVACLPSGDYGIVSANTVAMQLLSSFRSIRFGLMVGIGGGVPNNVADIRLGDVVISKPTDIYGGVVQYDYGKALNGGRFQRTGMLNCPPQILLTALSKIQANHLTEESKIADYMAEIRQKFPGTRLGLLDQHKKIVYISLIMIILIVTPRHAMLVIPLKLFHDRLEAITSL